jgi:hypothetical protein
VWWKLKNCIMLNVEHVCSSRKLDGNSNISRAWVNIGENVKISAKESVR